MLTFLEFILESNNKNTDSYHVEMYLWEEGKNPLFRIIKTGGKNSIEEGFAYTPNEEDSLGGKMYKHVGSFKPSSHDHETIAREFHHHLHKHGFYMHTETHPLVMSPKDQKFKSEFKKRTARTEQGKIASQHELPHHDGSPGRVAKPGQPSMGRFVGLWSTRGSTHVFDPKTNKRIEKASKDEHVTLVNDEKVKHAASGEHNRWFLRAGEIRKIPQSGSIKIGKTEHKVENGKIADMDSYVKSKKHNVPKHHQDVTDYLQNRRKWNSNPASEEEKASTLSWMEHTHPEFHALHKAGTLEKRGVFVK